MVYQVVKHPKRNGYFLLVNLQGEQYGYAVFKTLAVAQQQADIVNV